MPAEMRKKQNRTKRKKIKIHQNSIDSNQLIT